MLVGNESCLRAVCKCLSMCVPRLIGSAVLDPRGRLPRIYSVFSFRLHVSFALGSREGAAQCTYDHVTDGNAESAKPKAQEG